jgi:hypothetical protein
LPGTVVVVKREGQFLEMVKKVPPHVGFDIGPHGVPPIGYKIGKAHPEDVEKDHKARHNKKRAVQPAWEELLYGKFGHHREGQIRTRDKGGADHIRRKEFPVGPVIAGENPQQGLINIDFFGHTIVVIIAIKFPEVK